MSDPVPTPALGIDATAQWSLSRRRRAQVHAVPFDAVPMDGDCAGARTKLGVLLGRCFSCKHWGLADGKMNPRVHFGANPSCADYVAVHDLSVPREPGVDQHLSCGGVVTDSTLTEGVPA